MVLEKPICKQNNCKHYRVHPFLDHCAYYFKGNCYYTKDKEEQMDRLDEAIFRIKNKSKN